MRKNLMNCGTRVLALTMLFGLMTACKEKNQNNQAQLVNVVEITPATEGACASYPAKTEAMNQTDLSFKVAGTIAQVLVKEGDHVNAGQVIARLDDRDYRTQLRATEAEYNQIKAECERVMEMHKQRAVSDNNYDKARYGLQQITEKLTHHRNQLSDCVICAPFSGFVDDVYKQAKETTAPGIPVVSVYSSKGVDVVINIPERAYAQRKQAANYTAFFNSIPGKSFPLTVRSVAAMANDNHLYEMRLSMQENVPDITPGMTAMVEVAQQQVVNDGAKVPMGAVWAEGQKSFVFIYDKKSSTVKKTEVKVERLQNDGNMVISSGLENHSQVVASGVHHLTDGQKVSVMKKTSSLNVGNLK
jgi:RND family efflux transporter MFP subunit